MTDNKVEDSSRKKWVKNRADTERTDSEISGSRIRFNVASEKKVRQKEENFDIDTWVGVD